MDHLLKTASQNNLAGYATDAVRPVETSLMDDASKRTSQHIDQAEEALRALSDLHARLFGPQAPTATGSQGGNAPAGGQIDAYRELQMALGSRLSRLSSLAYDLNGRI